MALVVGTLVCGVPMAHAGPKVGDLTIEGLIKAGWQIAGYTGAFDGRSSFILFRHPNETYLVQCRAGYDVTREERVTLNCYSLR